MTFNQLEIRLLDYFRTNGSVGYRCLQDVDDGLAISTMQRMIAKGWCSGQVLRSAYSGNHDAISVVIEYVRPDVLEAARLAA